MRSKPISQLLFSFLRKNKGKQKIGKKKLFNRPMIKSNNKVITIEMINPALNPRSEMMNQTLNPRKIRITTKSSRIRILMIQTSSSSSSNSSSLHKKRIKNHKTIKIVTQARIKIPIRKLSPMTMRMTT
jgi:hypothetical protein